MKKFVTLLVSICFSLIILTPVYSQKSTAIKKITKVAVGRAAKTTAKAAEKEIAKDAGKEIAEQYSKRIIRREILETAEKKGSKTLAAHWVSQAKNHLKKHSKDFSKSFNSYSARSKAYKTKLKSSRKNGGTTILRSDVGKIIERYEGKELFEFLEKNNKEIAKQLRDLMKKGGPFEHPDYHKFICEVGENGDVIIRNSHPDALSSAIRVKGNTITAYSGGTTKCGASNMFLDKPLPNKKYVVDDGKYIFSTDAEGRTSAVVAKYDKVASEVKPPLDAGRRKMGVLDKGGNTATHDAGHITQHNLGGINEGINLVPMNNTWQRSGGAWRSFEEQEEKIIAKALEQGKTVTSSRKLIYSGNSQIPSGIEVNVQVDGETMIATLLECP